MSDKLGQSLDEILATQRSTAGRGGRGNSRRGRSAGGRNATVAPVGGVSKSRKPIKGATKPTPTGPSAPSAPTGRIIVSNLPYDVSEMQIKEYFHEARLITRTVQLTYGPNGASRGEATITFHRPGDAAAAVSKLNGVKVDNRALKVELLVDAKAAAAFESHVAKKLTERITSGPKPQPKSAVPTKTNGSNDKIQASKRGGKRGSRGAARPAKKTAEELDLEMADYWESGNAAAETGGDNQAANGAAQPAANGDANMDDEIL